MGSGWAKHRKKDISDFMKFVENEWKKLKVDARNEFVIKEKIKLLKGSFRKWNREVFGWHDLKVAEGVENINDIDNLLFQCEGIEVQELVERRSLACKSKWRNLYIKDNTLSQNLGLSRTRKVT